MARWRPPPQHSTAIITRAGYQRLRAELDELWRTQRPEVVRALAAAAAEGDRSENAEYSYRKRQLAGIDRRVHYLGKRLPQLRVVDVVPGDREAVYFGAWMRLLDESSGELLELRIVGPDETDAGSGQVSIDAPLARAALGKRADQRLVVERPDGTRGYRILAVRYGSPAD
ncbi:MAG TPA: transcription elongation factor GreB [Xanthomonadaceae bacterium]|nr:transcription elongation factor GreB [Xanthomonadaceae bacterium]